MISLFILSYLGSVRDPRLTLTENSAPFRTNFTLANAPGIIEDIKIMNLVDEINNKFGYGKLRLSSDEVGMFNSKGKKKINWSMKSNYRSPCYTTNWYDIPKIKV